MEIRKEVLNYLDESIVDEILFEGAKIVIYVNDIPFFIDHLEKIKEIVSNVKKRIEVRMSPSLVKREEEAKEIIEKIIPKEAGVTNILFDTKRSRVIIEAEKPGLVIGKQGEMLQKIKKETLWVPLIQRTPPLKSQLIEDIRSVLYIYSDYRKKFLNKVGERIYNGWKHGERTDEWIRVSFLGGAREVGRSAILLQTQESRILMDCGINPAANNGKSYPFLDAPEFDINDIDAVIVTHAHLDHSGLVPYLYKFGYKGPVYMTMPTRDISALLQLDFIKIQRNEGKDPIYGTDEIKEMVKHTITLDYGEVTDITPDIRITLYNAGHILGSAMIHTHIGNGLHNIVYTGDIKFTKTNLLSRAVNTFPRVETLIMESTYGGKENVMPSQKEIDEYITNIIKDVTKRKGKVLIPVLGSGRGQEVLLLIHRLISNGEISEIPVYVDGMVWDITAIHTAYPEFLNSTVRHEIFHKDNNPFIKPYLHRVGSQKEREQIIEKKGSVIILATSGMLNGGPSVWYFKQLAENKKHFLLFTSYQAEGTLGRRIQNGEKEFNFREGDELHTIQVKMEIGKLEISGHADRKELMNFVKRCNPRPKKIIINHGEVSRCLDLATSIHKTFKLETITPRNLDAIRLR